MAEEFAVLLKALVAVGLGGALGWEREAAGKWAGLRTHMLVCLGATLFIALGQILLSEFAQRFEPVVLRSDPLRLLEAIATVVAFLGAGTIFRDRDAGRARGLTTAASLLATAGVGVAVALDRYIIACGVTLLGLFVLRVVHRLERWSDASPK